MDKKKKIIIPVVAAVLVIVVVLCAVVLPNAKKGSAYDAAIVLLSEKKFDEAKAAFEALGSYKDSKDMCKEAIYQKATYLYDEGDIDGSLECLGLIAGYKDVESMVALINAGAADRDYEKALDLMNSEKFAEAKKILESLGDFMDAKTLAVSCQEMMNASYYSQALDAIAKKDYDKAISLLSEIPGYLDVDKILQQTKDVKDNKPGAVISAAGGWKATAVYFNSTEKYTNKMETIGVYFPVYCHFTIAGPSGQSTKVHATITMPNGSTSKYETKEALSNGSTASFGWADGVGYAEGTLKVTLYDEKNNEIGSGSVNMSEAAATDPSLILW